MAEPTETQETAAGKGDEAPREQRSAGPRATEQAQRTFTAADLIARGSDFLGQPSYVVAGALHGVDPEEALSLDDARGRVEAWLEQPVTKEA